MIKKSWARRNIQIEPNHLTLLVKRVYLLLSFLNLKFIPKFHMKIPCFMLVISILTILRNTKLDNKTHSRLLIQISMKTNIKRGTTLQLCIKVKCSILLQIQLLIHQPFKPLLTNVMGTIKLKTLDVTPNLFSTKVMDNSFLIISIKLCTSLNTSISNSISAILTTTLCSHDLKNLKSQKEEDLLMKTRRM